MAKKYSLSVYAIFKDEAKYIQEWIEFHRIVGVEHFYLCNNDSSDDYMDKLKYYIDNGIVALFDYPGKKVQDAAANKCLEICKNETQWLAVIDLDEFIIPKEHLTIQECINSIIERYEKINSVLDIDMNIYAIQMSWLYYGTSFHKKPIADGELVLENYLNRIAIEDNDNWCKSIYFVDNIDYIENPHHTRADGKVCITELGEPVTFLNRSPITHADYLYVNHYTTRSEAEHLWKLTGRGWADGLVITDEHRNRLLNQGKFQFNKVYDPTTLRYVPAIKHRLREINNDGEK